MDKNNNYYFFDLNPETIELLSYFKSNEDAEVKVKFLDDICSKLIDSAIEVSNKCSKQEYNQILEEIYCINFFKKLTKSFIKENGHNKENVMKKVKLIYTITPETSNDALRVIEDIKNDMGMFPSSIIFDEKEFEIEDEKGLYLILDWIE